MAGSSAALHEDPSALTAATIDRHRAVISLMEELEAVDWYDQRVEATSDESLAEVLAHNRDEEKEHAAMTLEWLRRHDAGWDEHLRTYLFTDAPIVEVEARSENGEENSESADAEVGQGRTSGDLGIGSLRGATSL